MLVLYIVQLKSTKDTAQIGSLNANTTSWTGSVTWDKEPDSNLKEFSTIGSNIFTCLQIKMKDILHSPFSNDIKYLRK